MIITTPKLVAQYKAYTTQMDYYVKGDGMKALRRDQARRALAEYFDEVERYVRTTAWEPVWRPKRNV